MSKRLRERVLEVIQQLDYHPNQIARSLKIRQTNLIGLIVNDTRNPVIFDLLRGAEEAAWRANYMLIVFDTGDKTERERHFVSALRSRRVDGILLIAAGSSNHDHIAAAEESGIPVVCLERELSGLNLDCVVADASSAARQCVNHLVSLGHRRIGLLDGDPSPEPGGRHMGFRQTLEEHNIPYDRALVIHRGLRLEDGFEAGLELLSREQRPTAVLAANSLLALGFLNAMKKSGLTCPEDIALIAFDDPIFAEMLHPSLTAIAHPAFEIGNQGMELLLKRIVDPGQRRSKIVLGTKLVIRESSGSSRTRHASESRP